MKHETTIDLDTPHGYLEDVPAIFDLDVETYPAELFSHDGSRGTETSVAARIESIKLNGLTLRENELIAWLGQDTIDQIEKSVEETDDPESL